MSGKLAHATISVIATFVAALTVLGPSTAHAIEGQPTVSAFAFGEGNGRVAVTLSPTDTSRAVQAGLETISATWICDQVLPMIRQFQDSGLADCVAAVMDCSARAVVKHQSAGFTLARDGGWIVHTCWSYAYGSELMTAAEQMLAQWQQPSPTEQLALYNPLVDLRLEHPVSVKSVLEYQDPSGAAARTWLFYDWWVGPQTKTLTFRDWNGKPMVAWRRGDQFITYNYAFAEGQPYFMNPDVCLKAGLCVTSSYLPIVAPNGNKYLAKIQ